VRILSREQLEVFEQVTTSPNFLMIVIGAIIWLLGFYIWIIGPLFTIAGFGLTTIAAVEAAMTRPVNVAIPGLLIGGLLQLIGTYVTGVPLIGLFLGPPMVVIGGVLILFYGSSLALQRIDIPIVKDLEDFIESRKKKVTPKEPKEKATEVVEEIEEDEEPEE
jgi:hypothetical protein